MESEIEQIKALQEIDSEFIDIQRQIKAGPEDERQATKLRDEALQLVAGKEDENNEITMQIDGKNLEINTADAEIEKVRIKMSTIKNNKEYTLLKGLMTDINERKDKSETELLALMEQLDELKLQSESLHESATKAESNLENVKKEVAAKAIALRKQSTELRTLREKKANEIDSETLKSYEQTLRICKGVAMVSVKDGACQGCFRTLTPNVKNLVNQAKKLTKCLGCGRFLYVNYGPSCRTPVN